MRQATVDTHIYEAARFLKHQAREFPEQPALVRAGENIDDCLCNEDDRGAQFWNNVYAYLLSEGEQRPPIHRLH